MAATRHPKPVVVELIRVKTTDVTWYLLRLNATRPDFAYTMTDDEPAVMGGHSAFWREHLTGGTALILSPVADPAGPWGLCIAQTTDRAAAQALIDADPAVIDGVGTYDILELFSPVLGAGTQRE